VKAKILSQTYTPGRQGRVRRGGYYFLLRLEPLDWEAFAWPIDKERAAARSFWIDPQGDMYSHTGFAAGHPPAAKDAFWKPAG